MRLWTINRVIRRFVFVLVVQTGKGEPTRLWFERKKTFEARVRKSIFPPGPKTVEMFCPDKDPDCT